MAGDRIFQLSPLPKIGEGFREWSEAPSYEEGVGVVGNVAELALLKYYHTGQCPEKKRYHAGRNPAKKTF